MKKKVHVIFHTHWDREWYFTVDDSLVLMNKAFKEIIEALEKNNNLHYYLLDGQTSIIEEFLNLNPGYVERVKNLVKSGRLITGPWYTQPDVFNVHGESILRNLEIGIRQARFYGKSMMIGYLPDTFGINAQMPLIYNSVGITESVIRRGYDPKKHFSTEFVWKGLDGDSKTLTVVQPFGYSMGHPIRGARMKNLSYEHFNTETYPLLKKVDELSGTNNLMCTIGGDQVSMDDRFDMLSEELGRFGDPNYEFVQSSLFNFFEELKKENIEFPMIVGEFRDPKYARVHRTIGSSRYDIKKENHDAEQYLMQVSEVINVLSAVLGLDTDSENIERSWKYLLESHAHDSMGACNSDETNSNIINRIRRANRTAKAIFAQQGKCLAYNVDKKNYDSQFILVNGTSLSQTNEEIHKLITNTPTFDIYDNHNNQVEYILVKQQKVQKPRKVILTTEGEKESKVDEYYYINEIILNSDNIQPLGFTTFYIKELLTEKEKNYVVSVSDDSFIENNKYKIYIKNGQLMLWLKETDEIIQDFITLEDDADDGDLYDFSPIEGDKPIILKDFTSSKVSKGDGYQKLECKLNVEVPKKLSKDRSKRVEKILLKITVSFVLTGDEGIKCLMNIDNTALDHRLRVKFKNIVSSREKVYGDVPFGYLKRYEEIVRLDDKVWQDEYSEYPVDIYPMQNAVIMENDLGYTSIFTKGCKEYQVVNQNLYITLFRSVGSIGKSDLVYRPGRASGREYPTPESQLLKELSFEFYLDYYVNNWSIVNRKKEKFLSIQPIYQVQTEDKNIQQLDYFDINVPKLNCPSDLSLIEELPTEVQVSSIQLLENNKLLLRIKNETMKQVEIDRVKISGDRESYWANSLGEREMGDATKILKPNSFANVVYSKKINV